MDITAIQGKINLSTVNLSKSLTAYIARPDAKIIARIRGITRMDVKAKFVDISEIRFEVSKYTTNMSSYKFALNPVYNSLHAFCCILVPELGQYGLFRIEEEPEIVAKNIIDEKKVFTAYTYESILQYENLVRFDINQGTDTSLEMYDSNLNAAGMPMNKIQLYNPNNASLSLLNLVLEDDYYGWSIGHVDASVRSKVRAFSVDNQNVYSFLREDCQKAFGCVFDFDTIDKEINVYDAETVGNNTNVYLSFQNFVNQMNVSQTNDSAYTVFNVAGDNGLDISRVNFGSNKIVNISYPLSLLDSDIQDAYSQYVTYRESQRTDYINAYKRYTVLLGERNSILDRQPQDVINNNWSSTVYYSLEDLQADLQMYQSIVDSILLLYTRQDSTIDYEALDISPDASLYYSYHDVVIPDITAEIAARQSPEDDVAAEVDADVVWGLYGLNDLELKLKSYKNIVAALTEQGYNNSWSSSSSISRDTWDAHHDEYTEYSGYVSELTTLINSRKSALDDINDEIDECLSDIVSIASLVKLENYFARFTNGSSYVATIKSLYKESDYKDDNYLITDFDDTTSIIAESQLLLAAAQERLEIESRPQLTWSIDSDNLFAIPELSAFRSHIQNGDFCTVVYGGDKTNYSPTRKGSLDVSQGHLTVYNNENLIINAYNKGLNPRNRFYDTSFKMRIVEINFDGLNIGGDFELVFSDVITTTKDVSDVESLIGSFVSSRTNSIQAATLSTASSTARTIASSVIRPYIEAMQMQVANLSASQVYADDIEALRAKVDTLIADYVEANRASIFELRAGTISADKSITLVSRDGYGSIEMTNASMDFKDSSGNTRVHIGKSDNNSYSVDIYSAAGVGGQTLLWSTNGITIDAIADGMITNAKLAQVSADKVTAGTLTSRDGTSYWNLDTGELSLNGYVINARVEYALGDSPTIAPISGWSTSSPTWTEGKYVWQRTTLTKTGSQPEVTTVCIQGATGANAKELVLLTPDGDSFVDGFGTLDIVANMYDGGVEKNSSVTSWSWSVYSSGQYTPITGANSYYITVNGSDIGVSKTYRCVVVYQGVTYTQYKTITNISPSEAIVLSVDTYESGTNETTAYARLFANGEDITQNYPSSFYTWLGVTESETMFLGHGYSVVVNNDTFEYGGVVRLVFSGTEHTTDSVVRFVNDTSETSIPHITVGISPIQDTSNGSPSSSNVCPISGYSSIKVCRTGKNIIYRYVETDGDAPPLLPTDNGLTYYPDSDGVKISGTSTATSTYRFTSVSSTNGISAIPYRGKKLIASIVCEEPLVKLYCGYYNSNGVETFIDNTDSDVGDLEFTVPDDAVIFDMMLSVESGVTLSNVSVKLMLRMKTDVDSEEYDYCRMVYKNIDMPQAIGSSTIYGGVYDLTNGTITVTHDCIAEYNGETLTGEWLSSMDVYQAGSTPTTGAQVVYELAIPRTYNVQNNSISALSGINYIWSNTCDITVDYYNDGEGEVIYGDLVSGYYLDDSKIKTSQYSDSGIVVYPVASNVTYYVTWLADTNSYAVAFGNTTASGFANDTDVYLYEDCTNTEHTNYAVTNTNYQYMYVYFTSNNGSLNENYVRVTRDVPLYSYINDSENDGTSSGYGVASVNQISDFLDM